MVDTGERLDIDVGKSHAREVVEDRPHRLRDLHGRDLSLALGLLTLVLVPFIVALARAYSAGWTPSGDVANIAVRSLDVFTRHPPLTGLPSTSYLYGNHIFTYHPGPIEFYLLAVPIRVLGTRNGMLLTVAAINAAAVLIALWVFYRRAGIRVMMWAGFLMLAVIWSQGTTVLTEPLSSTMTRYSLLCTAVLAWAVADGDLRLLPLAAFVASYAAQQHLAATMLVGALGAFAVVSVVASRARRRYRGDTSAWRGVGRYAVVAVVVLGVCWAPVAIDQATGHPGNLTKIRRLVQDGGRETLGPHSGVVQAVHAIVPPTILGRDDTSGLDIKADVGWLPQAGGALVVAALVAVVWVTRRRRRALAFLAGTALVLIAAGVINGASVPRSIESFRSNLYPWTWSEAFLTWTALGWAAALLVGHLMERRAVRLPARGAILGPVTLLVCTALITVSTTAITSADDRQGEPWMYPIERAAPARVLHQVDRDRPVVVVSKGTAAVNFVGPAVVLGLVKAGVDVELPPGYSRFLGKHRRYRPGSHTSGVLVVSSNAPVTGEPGRVVASEVFRPAYSKLLDELVAEARAAPVQLAPDASARVAAAPIGKLSALSQQESLTSMARALQNDPRRTLTSSLTLELVKLGVFAQPAFDLTKVRRLQALVPHRLAFEERVEVRVLTPTELRAADIPELGE